MRSNSPRPACGQLRQLSLRPINPHLLLFLTLRYTNPKFMVTIVSGASGDIEGDDGCGKDTRPSFTCSENYGW